MSTSNPITAVQGSSSSHAPNAVRAEAANDIESPATPRGNAASEAALLQVALEHLPHGMCMFDGNDRLLLANRRYQSLWNLPDELLRPGTSFAEIMSATRGLETEASRRQPQLPSGTAGTRRREWQLDNGSLIEVTVTRMADGSCVALHEDITEQRRAQTQVIFLASHDALTGLPNRGALRDELQRLLARNKRGEDLAVLCLDLDRFKVVNDMLGHSCGDELLRQVAKRLRHCARETDFVVRLGGDEFAVLQCAAPQPSSSTLLADRIITALGTPFDLNGNRAHIGCSAGIAIAPLNGDDPEQLLKSADLALYRAKSDGRGVLRYFEPDMDLKIQSRRELEADLRGAMASGQFRLAYQPQVDTDSGTVNAFEALLRWQHPVRGSVSPAVFIPLAEETGLIVAIGSWVLDQACRDAASWPAAIGVAINVSAVQFADGSLVREVMRALDDSGLDAGRLELEITESVLMRNADQALTMLRELRQRGVRVAMDDFGTGYSSLSYLRSFPFDRIKIDRSFIHDIATNTEAQAIVRAVSGLGRSLGMATTVEGVETLGQLAAVRREGCRDVQGYLFSRPHPVGDVPHMIAAAEGQARASAKTEVSIPCPGLPWSGADERFHTIVEAQEELILLVSPNGTLVYVNPAYARRSGRGTREILGSSLFACMAPEDRRAMRSVLHDVLATGLTRSSEHRISGTAGNSRIAWSIGLQREGEETLLRLVGRDVTNRSPADRLPRESENFLARMGRVSGVGGWQLDVKTGTVSWTDETRRIHEVNADYQPTLATALAFYEGTAKSTVDRAIGQAIETGEPWDLELPFVTAAGRRIWVRIQGEAEKVKGKLIRLVGAIQDITSRKSLERELASSEAFIRKITDNLPLRIAYVDKDLRYQFVNEAQCRHFERPRDEVLGSTRDDLLHRITPAPITARIRAVLEGQAQRFEYEESTAEGTRHIEVQLVPDMGPDGQSRGYFYTGLDITERSQAEQALRALTHEAQRQSDVLRLVTEAIPATVVVVSADGKYRFANGAFESYCGLAREQIIGRPAVEVLGHEEVERRRPFMEKAMKGETVTFSLDQDGPDGKTWIEYTCIPLRLEEGSVDGFVGISQDITPQVRERDRLAELSLRDPLTGLLNRAGFDSFLTRHAEFSNRAMGLLYVDLDRFKAVNDTYGHPIGDRLLQRVSQRLKSTVRPTDAVARLGGDEFAVLLCEIGTKENAAAVAEKVVQAIGTPFEIDGHRVLIGASIGVAFDSKAQANCADLIGRADSNLYRAKEAGRGRAVV